MALLEIIHLTGDVERRDLYKRQPMTIGSHPSNDVRIDEEGVEIMHCRISWNKDSWEAVAAGAEPFELNGVPVQRSALKSGDTLRFGTVDIRFHGGVTVDDTPPEAIGIKPTSDDAVLATKDSAKSSKPAAEKPKAPRSDEQLMQSLELLAFDSKSEGRSGKPKKSSQEEDLFDVIEDEEEIPSKPASKSPAKSSSKAAEESGNEESPADNEFEDASDKAPKQPSAAGVMLGRLKGTLSAPELRPGEQDPLKSPLVLGLVGGSALLILLGFTFYFIAFRRVADTEFAAAKSLLDEQKFQQGSEALQEFINFFPKHEKATEAKMLIGLAKIDQQIGAGAGNFAEGVKMIREFVSQNSDEPNFEAMKQEIANRAGDAAFRAAVAAGKTPSVGKALLATALEAKTLLSSYSPKDSQPTQRLAEISQAMRTSEDLIRKFVINEQSTASIRDANTAKKPMEALRLRRELMAQYPEYANDKSLRTLLDESMQVELSLVTSASPNTPALAEDDTPNLPPPRTAMFHARSRNDQVSVNEVVWVLSKDCLYGADTVTGLPVWRRVVGTDPAFFPVEENVMPSLIYFDSDRNELVRIKRSDGSLVWRQAIDDRAAGEPLIDEGQIYLTTMSGSLLKIDLDQGTIISTLTFSQPVNGPVPLGSDLLLVVGDQDVVYTLSKRPLECVAVSYFGQKSQSVVAPLVSMGPYAAYIENLSEESAKIHLLKQDGDKPQLIEVGSGMITGMVVDKSIIRGRDLFVPSTVERVSAFSVSDTPNEPPLTTGPTFQVQGAKGSPIYLTTGPERQVWMSSSALRRLQLTTDTIQADPNVVAIGLSSQPNQHQGALLFNARRRPFSDAVTLTQTERDTLTSDWQLIAGAKIMAASAFTGENPSITVVNEGGATFRITAAQLSEPGFQTESAFRLPVNDETIQPLQACALPDGQLAVVCGDPEPRIWLINRLGQVEKQGTLPTPPQSAPAFLDKRIVVPLAGKLHVARLGQADTIIQDYVFPTVESEAPPVWRQILTDGDRSIIGLTESGDLLQFRLEPKPKPHLAEVSRLPLPSPVIGHLVMSQGSFAAACTTGEVLLFDASKLEPKGQRTMEIPPSGAAYVTTAGLLVETGSEELHCLNLDATLTTKWTIKIDGTSLAGQPLLVNGRLAITFESGLVRLVDPETGETVSEHQAAGSLDSGPMIMGESVILTTWDGSLVTMPTESSN